MEKKHRLLSVIVSVYNEQENLPRFYEEARQALELAAGVEASYVWEYELIFVNDGSIDGSRLILEDLAEKNGRVKLIAFSRNFGHEAAMLAGIDKAAGDFLLCMDADLQNPPELIPEILHKHIEGNEIILMSRKENKDAGRLKNMASSLFYKLLNRMSSVKFERNVSDFFGFSKKVADILRTEYRERCRYLRGYVQSVGFQRAVISYVAPERFAGSSKYSIKGLFKIAVETVNCFSVTPLKAGVAASALSILLTLVSFAYYIVFYVRNGYGSGTALLCCIITLLFSLLFVLLGTIGEYLGMLMTETKGRPIYIIMEERNFGVDGGDKPEANTEGTTKEAGHV